MEETDKEMYLDEVASYISIELSKGFSKRKIKKMLLTHGWNEIDINEGFRRAEFLEKTLKGVKTTKTAAAPEYKKRRNNYITYFSYIVFVVLVAVLFIEKDKVLNLPYTDFSDAWLIYVVIGVLVLSFIITVNSIVVSVLMKKNAKNDVSKTQINLDALPKTEMPAQPPQAPAALHKIKTEKKTSEAPAGQTFIEQKSVQQITANPIMKHETELDLLHNFVREKGTVRITDTSLKFGVSKDMVEEWAKILEKSGLIEIIYPLAGDLKLKIKK